jgi:hypothetical protein
MATRSEARAILAYPFTLHPRALRALGVPVPEVEPVQVQEDEWAPYTPSDCVTE